MTLVPTSPNLPTQGKVDKDLLSEVMAHARADETRRSYASIWRMWDTWAQQNGFVSIPADPAALANYLVVRADEGVSISTIRSTRAAIGSMHRDYGYADPMDTEGVKKIISGLSRIIGKPQRQASPLTREVQSAINATAHFPRRRFAGGFETQELANARATGDIAIVSIMRDGLLRRSEAAALTWEDVEFLDDGSGSGRITIRKSKTDQTRQGTVLYIGPESAIALQNLKATKPYHSGPDDKVIGLSARQISERIGSAAKAAGYPGNYSGHSPRVGMAIDLASAGCELPELMTAGRWTSPGMPARYTRSQSAGTGAVAKYYNR